MLTQKDLLAIQKIVDGSVLTSEKRLEEKLMNAMGKNTEDLIDLIKVGFHMTDTLEARVTSLEKKVFSHAL